MAESENVTALLEDLREGGEGIVDRLFPLVYDELQRLAHRQLQRQRPGQTLNTTALVHEAYLKLVDQTQAAWNDRAHFFAVSAKAMRHIILNYARDQSAQKRGGERERVTFDERLMVPQERAQTLLLLDEVLDRLTERDARMGRVVELRFFGGMTEKEIAQVLDVSARTVRRDWRSARAWLSRVLSEHDGSSPEATSE